jgi:hypothetical protein
MTHLRTDIDHSPESVADAGDRAPLLFPTPDSHSPPLDGRFSEAVSDVGHDGDALEHGKLRSPFETAEDSEADFDVVVGATRLRTPPSPPEGPRGTATRRGEQTRLSPDRCS